MQDFGLIGVIVCQMIFGITFTVIYLQSKKRPIILIFYGLYSFVLIDQIRDELFFTTFVHINIIINLIIIWISYWFLTEFKYENLDEYKNNIKRLIIKGRSNRENTK